MKRTAPLLIASVTILAIVALKQLAPKHYQVPGGDGIPTVTGQGLLRRSDAISVTMDWIAAAGKPFHVDIMEPRLMTYGDYHRLESANVQGTPGPMTSSDIEIVDDPVWAVAFSVDINLARTSMFGGSDQVADHYHGSGGDDHVWPDGYSRGSIVIDARTGDLLASTAHSRVSTNDHVFDRLLAFPTAISP